MESSENEIIQQFVDEMAAHGCPVRHIHEVKSDDKRHRIACSEDKPRVYTLSYCLKIEDGIGIGWFHSFKFGISAGTTVKFISKLSKKLSAQERELANSRMELMRKEAWAKEKRHFRRRQKMAASLEKVISRLPEATRHPYLSKKKVGTVTGLKWRAKGNELIVPIYQEDGLAWTVQKIGPATGKWFMYGGEAKNGFFPLFDLANEAEPVAIAIVEGLSTGITIAERSGIATICAMTAGNLKPVAMGMRKKFPNAKIVMAADNDRHTTGNPGRTKAEAAAKAVGGHIIYPDFPADDIKGNDWNDHVNAYGAEQLRRKLEPFIGSGPDGGKVGNVVIPAASIRAPLELQGDWRDGIHCDKQGIPLRGSIHNAMLVLEHHEDYQGLFRLNEFSQDIFLTRCPPWTRKPDAFKPHRIEDVDITNCTASLEQFGITPDTNKITKAIIATSENNKFHPAREYFDSLEWDGNERLDGWLQKYMGAATEDNGGDDIRYLSFIGKKWLTAAVKRIYEPGCKFDHVLVLEGLQGKGKSAVLEAMATFEGEAYFTDNIRIADIQNKDSILMLQGSVIIELAELAGFNKKDDEEIKGWITLKQDRCRRPYDKSITIFKRQFVLSATTNNYDYLKDPTGNRRYWPFKTGKMDTDAIKLDSTQLWAQAVHEYKNGLYIGPTEDEMIMATAAQAMRRSVDAWEDAVMGTARALGKEGFKVNKVLEHIGIEFNQRDQRTTRRVTAILQANGFENKIVREGKTSQRLWVAPPEEKEDAS